MKQGRPCRVPRGVGKTRFGLGVACATAAGGTFLRWSAPKPRRVLYLDGELPAQALQEMALATVAALGIDEAMLDNITLVTPDLLDGFPPDLSTAEGQEAVAELLPGVELVIADNLATLGGRGDESEGAAWLPIQGWILGLRRQGISAFLVHHSGKGGQQRGTSRREDVLDTVIGLRRPTDYTPDQGARFEVHFEKGRGFCGDGAKPFEAWLATDAGNRLTWLVRDLEHAELMATADLACDGLSQRAIAKELGISHQAVGKRLRRARQMGLIGPETAGGNRGGNRGAD